MRVEIFIFAVTAFFIYDTFYDGKITKLFFKHKKYFTIAFYGLVGISMFLLIRRNPSRSKSLLLHANNLVKGLPIDKSSMDMLSPIIDFTSGGEGGAAFMTEANNDGMITNQQHQATPSKATKRSVSETKKKYVASAQNWKCGNCKSQLNAWFEVDHKVRLEHGGSNEVQNLVALCRECHGRKTAMENMG